MTRLLKLASTIRESGITGEQAAAIAEAINLEVEEQLREFEQSKPWQKSGFLSRDDPAFSYLPLFLPVYAFMFGVLLLM